jgi:hypothetical protein
MGHSSTFMHALPPRCCSTALDLFSCLVEFSFGMCRLAAVLTKQSLLLFLPEINIKPQWFNRVWTLVRDGISTLFFCTFEKPRFLLC